jgi:hypothetical protein
MTRFKELQRIEAAIEHKSQTDLQWALEYCKMRLRIAQRKGHTKYWREIEKKVLKAVGDKN